MAAAAAAAAAATSASVTTDQQVPARTRVSLLPQKPKPKPKKPKDAAAEARTREESEKRADRRRRAKEAPPLQKEDEQKKLAQMAAQAAMIMLGLQTPPPMNAAPAQACSSNASAARPRSALLDAWPTTESPAPAYGFLPGRDPTPPPFFSVDMEDSSPARTRVSIDLNTAPVSGMSTAPSSKGAHRPPPTVRPMPRNLLEEMQDMETQPMDMTTEEVEGYMSNMINEDGQASYVHPGDELYEEDDVDELPHIDDMPMFMDELTQQAKAAKRNVKRGIGFTEAEDECLIDTWIEVGQNTIVGAEMKGNAYWRRMHRNYQERAVLPPYSMVTTRSELSIQKRFGLISSEYSKFTGSFEHAVARPQSSVGIGDLAFQALTLYKAEHGGKSFNFAHCYKKIKDNQKWKELHNALKKGAAMPGGVPPMATGQAADGTTTERPRGRSNSKLDLKRDATTIALQETLQGFISQKDKTSDKKDEREEKKRREREEITKNYFIVQTKKLEIEEENAKKRAMEASTRAMEAENKRNEVELALAAQEAQIMAMDLSCLTPRKKAYFEKKQQRYMQGEE